MTKTEKFFEVAKLLENELEGIRGKRKAQAITETILDNHDLVYSKSQLPSYTAYYVTLDDETGASRTLFISYKYNGAFQDVKTM